MQLYFAKNLAYLRKQKGFSQAEFSERIGMSRAATALYEMGKREPTLSNLAGIAQILEVSIDDLLTKDLRPAGLLFGRNLRYLRESINAKGKEIAKIFGVNGPTYSKYENGLVQPNMEGLIAISEFFGVPIDDLLKKDLSKEGERNAGCSHVPAPRD